MRKSRRGLDNRRARSCCGHVLMSGASRHVVSQQLPKISLIAALRISFWPIRDIQNPITTDLMDKIPDHGAHFATERPLVVTNRGSKLSETFSFLKCRACLYKVARYRVSNGIDLKWFLTGRGGVTPGRTTRLYRRSHATAPPKRRHGQSTITRIARAATIRNVRAATVPSRSRRNCSAPSSSDSLAGWGLATALSLTLPVSRR